ncbi:MAG: hypothetical protein JO262_02700 [Solirubrobacterales bacterium]|nr:hypothetical protein [Solirubrobacterales bacterium]
MSLALAAPAGASVGWGINLDGAVAGDPPAFSYQSNPYLTQLLGGVPCRNSNAVCYARIYVPWDAVNDGRGNVAGGGCEPSPSGPGTPAAAFAGQLSAASRLVGMSHVLVTLTVAGLPNDDIWPTDAEYGCGLSGLERQAPGVVEWEVFNEPDSIYSADSTATGGPDCTHRNGTWVGGAGVQYQCLFGNSAARPTGGNGHGGSAQGAAYWYLDAKKVDSNPGHTLLAGGFNYSSSRCVTSSCYYPRGYFRVLSKIYPRPPDAIALNPYIDVSYAALNGGSPVPAPSSGLPSAQGPIALVDRFYASRPPIWFTEVGVWLTDPGKEPVTSGCGDGNPQDDGTWAGCLNGNPNAQALAAEGYLRLPSESPQVQRVYYYDFDNQNPGWDSGLVNISAPLLGPHGEGAPRTVWCVLHGFAQDHLPADAAASAMQAGAGCAAPAADVAYLSDPLPVIAAATLSPGQVGRDMMLTVAERIRALAAAITGSA